ncbi:hypothetical protein GVN16_03450 [Emticicia sp. CRIBPO]|uniref:hypothetical protein n=1 Tax=Emticicia sp. CRIBPO TaxID=2683258 RepID=UPI00141246EA|nr:hypothetical protein [Emticicia sp. CRIBPO]NBA84796.1 hypothetical protein [Emticicia sp. CRIBPO]
MVIKNKCCTAIYNDSAIAGATSKTLSASKPGEYRAVLTLKSNAATICEAVINLAGAPCKIYELDLSCQVPNNITLPNAVATGVQLAVGDEFTAGDYTVVVTEIISGSPTGWKGKGYVKMKLVAGIVLKKISVNFDNAVVNECYELASGSVITDYDPNWGGILDFDEVVNEASSIYSDVSNVLKDLFSVFTGTCDQIQKIEAEISRLEKGYLTDHTSEGGNNVVRIALDNLKASVVSLKECSSCTSSSARLRSSNSTTADCNAIFQTCVQKQQVFDQATVLNDAWLQVQGCEIIKKAGNTKCEGSQIANCFKGGRVQVTFVGSTQNTINILSNCRSELKDGQWLRLNGKNDEVSFDKAARYNIEHDNWNAYTQIEDRHEWYKWADKIARPRDNYWFAAAVDVTSWRAVGGAEMEINLGYVTDPEEYLMREVNRHLLSKNFKNFGPYLLSSNGKVKDSNGNVVLLEGIELEKKMVEIEQTEVENYLPELKSKFEAKVGSGFGKTLQMCFASNGTTKTPWDCAIFGINKVTLGETTMGTTILLNLITFVFTGEAGSPASIDDAIRKFKDAYSERYNFEKMEHRVFIGKKMAEYLRAHP